MTTLWILTFAKSCVRVRWSPAIPEIPYVYFRYWRECSGRTLSFSFLMLRLDRGNRVVSKYERGFPCANVFAIYQMELEVAWMGLESCNFYCKTFANDAKERYVERYEDRATVPGRNTRGAR